MSNPELPSSADPHGKGSPDNKPDRPVRRLEPDTNSSSVLPDPSEETGAEPSGGGYGDSLPESETLQAGQIEQESDRPLTPEEKAVGRRGVAAAQEELRAAKERADQRENPRPSLPHRELEGPDLDPERPF